jgi:23S rRNA (cytosine1962-C5)-methyltransferase
MTKIFLKPHREESLLRYHPWVFSGAIANVQGNPAEGDLVTVCAADGQQLAIGHWQIGSIAVRVLSFSGDPTAPDFWVNAIARALEVRKAVKLYDDPRTTCFRLVHGEGDGLPGLIIDWYDGVCVMQAHSVGMFRARKQICDALIEVFGDRLKAVYDKSSGTAPFKAGLELVDGYLWKAEGFASSECTVLENGHSFLVNWEEGQKTGFFLDQRDNRELVGRYAAGRNVLNLFCYTGGFSIYALAGGAASVDSVDSSARAMALVDRNVALGGFTNHTSCCEDAMDYLAKVPEGKYGLMIVDPPAFAKHRGALKNALRAYQRLNAAAISKVAPGGLVFTFSCSQVVDKIMFAEMVFSAAAQTGRAVRIVDRLCQGADHPVSIYHPEGEYLKGLLLYVE